MNRILIVDDELNMRLVLKAMLTKEGYEVFVAEDGLAALEVLKTTDIATIVTDLKMPRLDGMGLLNRVAKEYPSLPIIIITAYGTVNTAVDALKKGAFDYITKPFDQDDLRNVIRKAILTREFNQDEVIMSRGRYRPVRHRRRQSEDAGCLRNDQAGRTGDNGGAAHRGNRDREGTDRPRYTPQQPPEG